MIDFFELEPVLIVVAHPDDETIGLGGQLARLKDPYIIHVTDGAPRSIPARQEHAAMRRRELEAAMAVAGIDRRSCLELGAIDQESSFSLSHLTCLLVDRLREIQPKVVVTHPYEGGHPEHDSTAFIVQTAMSMIEGRAMRIEFPSYHNGSPYSGSSTMKVGEFLSGPPEVVIHLPPPSQERKRRMFECFESQQHVLKEFKLDSERFRVAPQYDFTMAPHPGKLYYEDKNWGVSGTEWRRLAHVAATELRLTATSADQVCKI